MELNVNSPAYFKEHYGIDNEVYQYCQNLYLFFKEKEYSDSLHIIGIVPVAAPQEMYDSGKWKECVSFRNNKSCASITIRMDFEEYLQADSAQKMRLTREMILKAVKKVKLKGKFDFSQFEKDLLTVNLKL